MISAPASRREFSTADITTNVQNYRIADKITSALGSSVWEGFNRTIWEAHDNGHMASGPTMQMQDVAAFDPMFWFFHANWDRLWWKWQQAVDATTLVKFKSTLSGPPIWLAAPFNALQPFATTAEQTIDIGDVAYVHPPHEAPAAIAPSVVGHAMASRAFRLGAQEKISIRVKGIDRLKIPGSFTVHLRADGKTIARQGFFQPLEPTTCSSCAKAGIVNIDFVQSADAIRNRDLSVAIEPAGKDWIGGWFPLSRAGNPTVNARFLLED